MSWTILPLYFQSFARGQSLPVRFFVSGQGTVGGNWAAEAYDYALGQIGNTGIDGQFLQGLVLDKMVGWDASGNQIFELSASYGPNATSEKPEQAVADGREPDEAHATLVSARMYGAESRIEVAEAVARFPSTTGVVPDHGRIIVTADGTGCPVLETQGDFTLQKRLPIADVSAYLKDVLEPLISPRPRMNSATFWGRPAGSLLLVDHDLGFQGDEGVINCHFQYKPNLISATIAGITGINANGHDHLEAFYVETMQTAGTPAVTRTVKELKGFYVYQVYKTGDFSTLKMTEPT